MAVAVDKYIKKVAKEYMSAKDDATKDAILQKYLSDAELSKAGVKRESDVNFFRQAILEFDKPLKAHRRQNRLLRKMNMDLEKVEKGIELEQQRKAGDKDIKKVHFRPLDLLQDNARLTAHVARRWWDRSKQGLENTALFAQEAIMETKLASKSAALGLYDGIRGIYDTAIEIQATLGKDPEGKTYQDVAEDNRKAFEARMEMEKSDRNATRENFEEAKKLVRTAQEARKNEANARFVEKALLDAKERANNHGTTVEQEYLKIVKRTALRSLYFLSNARVVLKQAKFNINQKEVEAALKTIDDPKAFLDDQMDATVAMTNGLTSAVATGAEEMNGKGVAVLDTEPTKPEIIQQEKQEQEFVADVQRMEEKDLTVEETAKTSKWGKAIDWFKQPLGADVRKVGDKIKDKMFSRASKSADSSSKIQNDGKSM